MKEVEGKKVFVALSGGVDSSVAAALLKERGYDVTGVFIKVWHPDFLPCQWRQDRIDAMRVCARLQIPFLTYDLEKEYKKEIIDYMISGYREGKTPNPDVMCNKQIKFGAYLKKALASGADFIATGHHVKMQKSKNIYKLLKAKDKEKDQSYFLWTLTQEQLRHSLFPTGEFSKPKVREIAARFNLAVAEKKDSQGLCFIGKLDIADFLKNYIEEKKGDVLTEEGRIIGYHSGVTFLTIGQRHGFTITDKGTHDTPYYIISKDILKNTITVSHNPCRTPSVRHQVKIKDVNWIGGEMPNTSKKYQARIRYRQELQDCKIIRSKASNSYEIEFDESQVTSAEGQSLVVYDGEECLGGGIIET